VESAEDQTTQFEKPGDSLARDARLLGMVAEGDQRALAAFYHRRSRLIYSLLARMLINEMEAQEALQDTFIQIMGR